jgi:hypothetical protein
MFLWRRHLNPEIEEGLLAQARERGISLGDGLGIEMFNPWESV